MADHQADLLQGTLDLLILKTLAPGPHHGWGVSQRIQQMSRDVLQVNQGSLYPALHRLERGGLVRSEWQIMSEGPPRKYYRITEAGRATLRESAAQWADFSHNLLRLLDGLA